MNPFASHCTVNSVLEVKRFDCEPSIVSGQSFAIGETDSMNQTSTEKVFSNSNL